MRRLASFLMVVAVISVSCSGEYSSERRLQKAETDIRNLTAANAALQTTAQELLKQTEMLRQMIVNVSDVNVKQNEIIQNILKTNDVTMERLNKRSGQ